MNFKALVPKIPRSVLLAILIVVLAKVLIFSVGYVAASVDQGPASPLTILMNQFAKPGAAQDSLHYIDIAKNWYVNTGDQANFIVFFPLYPVLIRLITVDFSTINLSALIVSNVCSLIASLYLFKLAKFEFGDSVAVKAVLFLSIFPTAYFLSVPYTEGLFFALTITSIYYARIGKWQVAGFLGLFAALTRIAGLLLLPVLLVEYLHQKGWKPQKADLSILWVLLPLVGFLIYLNINNQVTGNPFTFMAIERTHWYNYMDPLAGFTQSFAFFDRTFPDNLTLGIAPVIFAFFGLAMVLAGFLRRLRPSYNLYMLLAWMLAISTSFWISVPRYIMAMFPMFILLGLLSKRKTITLTITIISLVLLVLFTLLFSTGRWAF